MKLQTIGTVVLTILWHQFSFAQTDSVVAANSLMALSNGSQCLQFFLVGQVTLAFKHHVSNQSALRLTADISGLFEKQNEDYSRLDFSTQSRERTINNQSVTLGTEYVYYFESVSRARLFVGIGPSVTFTRSRYVATNTMRTSSTTVVESNEQTNIFWDVGITGSAGIECQLYAFLSLIAQYKLSATYGPHKSEGSYSSSGTSSTQNYEFIKIWRVQLSSIQIGLSIYL